MTLKKPLVKPCWPSYKRITRLVRDLYPSEQKNKELMTSSFCFSSGQQMLEYLGVKMRLSLKGFFELSVKKGIEGIVS